MLSNAFKSAETSRVAAQTQGINTITSGIKDAGVAVLGGLGFGGKLPGPVAKGAKHALAGRIGGIGGNIMLATMEEKIQSNSRQSIYDIQDTEAVNKAFDTAVASNMGNIKAFETVWEKLSKAREQREVQNAEQEIMKNLGGEK